MELVCGLLVAERFRLVRQLGKGGMGAVWLAQHQALDVPCAIKFIHEEAAQSADLRARFEREAKAAAQLRSPHVVQILDHGVWRDAPYIAMEYLEGEDLGQRLTRVGILPPSDTVSITVQIARALTKAHAAGLVHRDLKPANVFLVRDDDREIAKVLDFGVAKVSEVGMDGSTKTGSILGTPYYMSPEQARGMKGLDHRADLWALAVVVYQCLTGRLPFMAEAFGELLVKIIMDPLPIPSQVAAVPPGFDAWWARAVNRDPNARFQSAKELADALGMALGVTMRADVESSLPGGMSTTGNRAASGSMGGQGGGTMLVGPTPMPHGSGVNVPVSGVSTSNAGLPIPNGMTPVGPMGLGPNGSWPGAAPTPLQQSLSVSGMPRRGGGGLAIAIVGALLLGGAGVFFFLRSGSSSANADAPAAPSATAEPPPAAPSAAPSASAFAAASASAAPSSEASADAAVSAEPESVAPSASTLARRPASGKWPPAPAASAKAKPNCDPNFTLDASGQKHFKPECFQ